MIIRISSKYVENRFSLYILMKHWGKQYQFSRVCFKLSKPVRNRGSNKKTKKIKEKENCFQDNICFLRIATNKNQIMKFVDTHV